jgi:hypothetical protein
MNEAKFMIDLCSGFPACAALPYFKLSIFEPYHITVTEALQVSGKPIVWRTLSAFRVHLLSDSFDNGIRNRSEHWSPVFAVLCLIGIEIY